MDKYLRLWNPTASSLWGIVLTPVFSTYLHLQNWKILAQPIHLSLARRWFIGSMVWTALAFAMGFANPRLPVFHVLGWIFLAVWYFSTGRGQSMYITERFGASYDRKPMVKAICVALGICFLLGLLLGFILAALPGAARS